MPDWNLLPNRPAAFFELPDSFDRKQLRRSYSRLIREFKPESHPREFQRIREAYESLDAQLRYGRRENDVSLDLTTGWQGTVSESLVADGSATEEAREAEVGDTLSRRAESTAPRELYESLRRQPDRSPYDYYALAVLGDLADRQDPLIFLRWLLTGLKAHRGQPALLRLVHEFLRSDVPDQEIRRALLATAKVVTTDRFYFLTEPLWDRLLRVASFPVFRRTLDSCERELRDHRLEGKMAFYIHVVRQALWKADEEWIARAAGWLEQHGAEVPSVLDTDLELTTLLIEYRRDADRFRGVSRIHMLIDQAIRTSCAGDAAETSRCVVACQDEIARDARGVMEAFPLGDDPSWRTPLLIYAYLVEEVSQWVEARSDARRPAELEKQCIRMLAEMRGDTERTAVNCYWMSKIAHFACGGALALGPVLSLWGIVPSRHFTAFAVIWTVAAVIVYLVVIRPKWTDPWLIARIRRRFLSRYLEAWRPRLFRFVHATSSPFVEALTQVHSSAVELGDDYWIGWLFEFAGEDRGLEIYARAQPFLR